LLQPELMHLGSKRGIQLDKDPAYAAVPQ
jgi:hypothetical protein